MWATLIPVYRIFDTKTTQYQKEEEKKEEEKKQEYWQTTTNLGDIYVYAEIKIGWVSIKW